MKAPSVEPDAGNVGTDPSQSLTPPSLLERLRVPGDSTAWERLWHLYGPTVERWCRQSGLSAEDAADVRQEVFHTVARGIADFRRERPGDSFRGWLYTTTRRRLLDHWRRVERHPRATGGTGAQDLLSAFPVEEPSESEAVTADARRVYQQCVRLIQTEFEERTWQAFWRVTVDGRAAVEVATELGMTPGAVYIAKSRVLKRLRAEFAELL